MAIDTNHSENRIDHLNSVLRAIREVNQLILRTDNVQELIQKVCETLISSRGYSSAWITLPDEEETALITEISENIGLALNNLIHGEKKDSADTEGQNGRDEWEKTFDAIPDLIMIIDTDHRIVRANKAMVAKLGCSVEDATGCHCFEVVHGLSAIPDFCPHARSILSNNEEHSEVTEYRLGGIFNVTTTPLFNEKGLMTGSVHVARDITLHRKKELLLAETLALGEFALKNPIDELLTMAIDNAERLTGSQIGFLHFLDEDETTLFLQAWSTNTLKLFCTAEGKAMHYPVDQAGVWVDCVHDRRPVIHNDYATLPHLKGLPGGHAMIVRELTVPVIRGENIVAIMGVGNKPTDYDDNDVEIVSQFSNLVYEYVVSKRYEEALHRSESYARALLDAIPDLIFRINREGVYLDYKGVSEELHYQAGAIVGKNNRDITPPYFADLIETKIRLTLAQRDMEIFDYQLPVPGKGLRDFEARMVPNGPDEVIAISRDITEQKKASVMLQKKIEELESFKRLTVDRELKMIELKKEINTLLNRVGEGDKYVIHQIQHK